MSVKVMDWVWRFSPHKGSTLLLLLAVADCAHDDGSGAYPSVETLATKTRLSERGVQYGLRQLEIAGSVLCYQNQGPRGANLYAVVMESASGGVQRLHPSPVLQAGRGAKIAPLEGSEGCKDCRGAKIAPVQNPARRGATAIAPEPSRTVITTTTEGISKNKKVPFDPLAPAFLSEMRARFPAIRLEEEAADCLAYCRDHHKGVNHQRFVNWFKNEVVYDSRRSGGRPAQASPQLATVPSTPVSRRVSCSPTANDISVWERALDLLRSRVSKTNFKEWLEGTILVDLDAEGGVVVAEDETSRAWLASRMGGVVTAALRGVLRLDEEAPFVITFEVMEITEEG